MKKFLLLVGLIIPTNVQAQWYTRALDHVQANTSLEMFDRTTSAVFWNAESGNWLGGFISPFAVYKETLGLNVGLAAPLNATDNTTLLTGLDLRLTKPVKKGLDYLYNYLPFVRDHMGVVKKATDLLSVGVSGGYDYRNGRWNYGYFLGLTIPLPGMSVSSEDLSTQSSRPALRRIATY